jgi:hypothetical protein
MEFISGVVIGMLVAWNVFSQPAFLTNIINKIKESIKQQ